MSTRTLPVPYQIETIGRQSEAGAPRAGAHGTSCTRRAPDFLVQLMMNGDPDLRKVLGRLDVADHRLRAYEAALTSRPSQQETRRLISLGNA